LGNPPFVKFQKNATPTLLGAPRVHRAERGFRCIVPDPFGSKERRHHMTMTETARLLTPGEVARMFRVDPKTVTRWAAGILPHPRWTPQIPRSRGHRPAHRHDRSPDTSTG
jgi:hypothetical protein